MVARDDDVGCGHGCRCSLGAIVESDEPLISP